MRWIRVWPASTATVSIPCRCPSRASCSAALKLAASSRMASFTAAPPAGRNSARYSRSTRDSHSASGSGGVLSTSIGRIQDKTDCVVVVLFAGLVEQGEPLAALPPGGAGELEPPPRAVGRVRLPIQPQQVGYELLQRIVGAGGR